MARSRLAYVVLVGTLAAGCSKGEPAAGKEESSAKPGAGGPAAPVAAPPAAAPPAPAAEPAAPAEGSEDALRKGKRTGLGGADEKPEVATEELMAAMVSGKFAASRLIDPAQGFVRLVTLPGGGEKLTPDKVTRVCGQKAEKELLDTLEYLVSEKAKALGFELGCGNQYLAVADAEFGKTDSKPGRAQKYATCGAGSPSEYGSNYDLIFVPDAERGLRLAAFLEWESGMNPDLPWAKMAAEMAKTRPPCEGSTK